ncbi:MAG: T9SS type A sorting domain-containing protein [Bacteroidetes bacterium]|nr:T9SS type A sorting domain-containing protein [Bacteroidota bacterium]
MSIINGKEALLTFESTSDIIPLKLWYGISDFKGTNSATVELDPFAEKIIISNNTLTNTDDLRHRIAATHYTSFFKMNDKFLEMDKDFKYLNDSFQIILETMINSPFGNNYANAVAMIEDNMVAFINPFNEKMRFGQAAGVLYHELGHCLNHLIYKDMGMQRMVSGAMHEGLADVHSAMMLRYQDVFRGEFADNSLEAGNARYLKNELKLEEDETGAVHFDGQILSGAMWDFGELTSLDLMSEYMHYTRFATPDGESNGTAFTNWLLQMIITDDDNGNLLDLTPHLDEIITAFDNHNITLALYMKYNYLHTPMPLCTKDSANPYLVQMTIPFVNNIKPVDDVYLHYSTDIGVKDSIKMQRDGDDYYAYIPKQPYYSFVNYHFSIHSPFDNQYVELMNDDKRYYFFVGYDTMFYDNSTTDKEYTITPTAQPTWKRINLDTINIFDYMGYLPYNDVNGDNCFWLASDFPDYNTSPRIDTASMVVIPLNYTNPNSKCYISLSFKLISYALSMDATQRPAFVVSVRNSIQNNWKEVYKKIPNSVYDYASEDWQDIFFCVNEHLDNLVGLRLKIAIIGRQQYSANFQYPIISCVDDILVLASDTTTSIKDIEQQKTIIFPNPTTGKATISMDLETDGNVRILLDNLLGEEIMEIHNALENTGTFTKQFSLESLPKGAYYIKVIYNRKTWIEKIVIE